MLQHLRALPLLALCLMLAGCGGVAGLAVGAIGRAAGTGDSYVAWKATMPAIPPGEGRLFVYQSERGGGLDTMHMAMGAEFNFLVDSTVCDMLGKTFTYSDLPAGEHTISADDVKEVWSEISGTYRKGRYSVVADLAAGGSAYVRLGVVKQDGYHLVPQIVDAATAEAEMKDLPLDNHFSSFKCHAVKLDERAP